MSDPVLSGYPYYYFTCDRDPTASEPLVFNNYSLFSFYWLNTVSNDFFVCLDSTTDSMVWQKIVSDNNISSILSSLGFNATVPRSRTQRTSPAFSTSYRPSTTSDVEVNLTLNFNAVLSLNSQVNIQTSPDNSTWTTLFPIIRTLALAINFNDGFTFKVPVGSYYRIVQSTGTAASIVSIYELTS